VGTFTARSGVVLCLLDGVSVLKVSKQRSAQNGVCIKFHPDLAITPEPRLLEYAFGRNDTPEVKNWHVAQG
jgi:hypothetical protein